MDIRREGLWQTMRSSFPAGTSEAKPRPPCISNHAHAFRQPHIFPGVILRRGGHTPSRLCGEISSSLRREENPLNSRTPQYGILPAHHGTSARFTAGDWLGCPPAALRTGLAGVQCQAPSLLYPVNQGVPGRAEKRGTKSLEPGSRLLRELLAKSGGANVRSSRILGSPSGDWRRECNADWWDRLRAGGAALLANAHVSGILAPPRPPSHPI